MFIHHALSLVWLKAVTEFFLTVTRWDGRKCSSGHLYTYRRLEIIFGSIGRKLLIHWVWNQMPSTCSRGKSLFSSRYWGLWLTRDTQAFYAIKDNSHAFSWIGESVLQTFMCGKYPCTNTHLWGNICICIWVYVYAHMYVFLLWKQLTALINSFHSEIIITLACICAHTQRDGDN